MVKVNDSALYTVPARKRPPLRAHNIPNLDCMSRENLEQFHGSHVNGKNSWFLFPNGGRNTKLTTAKLAVFAITLSAAKLAREYGDIDRATDNEKRCEQIYKSLPDYAKW